MKAVIDEHDRRIIERIAPRIRQDGLFFVGIDVIGGLLTEVNVTSPTGIQEMNALDGVRYEETVFDHVEALLEGSGSPEVDPLIVADQALGGSRPTVPPLPDPQLRR